MCIRDSDDLPALLRHRRHLLGLRDGHHADDLHARLLRHEDCLLYTSDAADERSSVDLGGRRIIKKKNNIELVSTTAI